MLRFRNSGVSWMFLALAVYACLDAGSAMAQSTDSGIVHWPKRWRETQVKKPNLPGDQLLAGSAGEAAVRVGVAVPSEPTIHTISHAAGLSSVTVLDALTGGPVMVGRALDATGAPINLLHPGLRARVAGSGALSRSGGLSRQLPLRGAYLSSGFGMRMHPVLGGWRQHSGVDLAAHAGTPVFASGAGTVRMADWNGGYGLMVAIDHEGGLQTRYGHMSQISVTPGQQLRGGEVIGYVGSTGRSTGSHLHYELRMDGRPVNPLPRP